MRSRLLIDAGCSAAFAARFIAAVFFGLVATAASTQEVSQGSVSSSSVGQVGVRQTRENSPVVAPTARIANRINNRVNLRVNNRIDRNYQSNAGTFAPYLNAAEEVKNASRRIKR